MTGLGEGPRWTLRRWFASPPYWDKAVQDRMPLRPSRPFVKDATLREGEGILGRP